MVETRDVAVADPRTGRSTARTSGGVGRVWLAGLSGLSLAGLVFCAALLAHGRTVTFTLVYEDRNDFASAVLQSRDLLTWQTILAKPARSLTAASYALDRALFGIEPWGFHLGSVLVHALNALLVLGIGLSLGARAGALFAALLFAVHPLTIEAVSYVSARSDLLTTTGLLVAVWGASTGSVHRAVVGCVLAFAAKETGLMAAAVVPVWALWARRAFPVGRWVLVCLISAPSVIWYAMHLADAGVSVTMAFRTVGELAQLSTRWVLPFGLSIEHDAAAWTWAGPSLLVLTAALLCFAVIGFKRHAWGCAVWVTLIWFSPRFVLPLYEGLHERHLYPMVAVWSLGAGSWLSRHYAQE